jgi:SAM-dependent methyltransferase
VETLNSERGASIYTPLTLKVYDWYVLGFSNRYVWQCGTRKIQLPFFKKHLGRRHLDVGVGTGFYLANTTFNPSTEISLIDLNKNSLNAAANHIAELKPACIQQDVFKPLALPATTVFDSISTFYLLHCLPGTFVDKGDVIKNLKKHLAPNGVLYGTTILGDTANHNMIGRILMKLYNKKGIFSNKYDSIELLREMLESQFQNVEIRQNGQVALFVAKD